MPGGGGGRYGICETVVSTAIPYARRVRVLMLGWEFPPYFAGGVGVVAHALTRALVARGVEVTYLMPHAPDQAPDASVEVLGVSPGRVRVLGVPSQLYSYATESGIPIQPSRAGFRGARPLYGPDLLNELKDFEDSCLKLVEDRKLEFDVVHAHDWTTFPAGIALSRRRNSPLAVHVHITEFDKTGGSHATPEVFQIERDGMQAAHRLIAVSRRVARDCEDRYGADPRRIRVIYNGIETDPSLQPPRKRSGPTVLFLGRVTRQKGPEFFVRAARRVLDVQPDVTFILAGTGDQLPHMVELSAELGLGPRMLFPGFVDRAQAAELYSQADVFVMPSVSEPFGIVPLEAMDRGVPVIVSRQSGVSELLTNALKIESWDVEDLSAKILAFLRYPVLHDAMRVEGRREVSTLHWDAVAEKIEALYREMIDA